MYSSPENNLPKRAPLPKVNMKHVLFLVFAFPIFFYPLTMLLSASIKEPEVGEEFLNQFVQVFLWMYPVVIFAVMWLLTKIWDRRPELGKKLTIAAIVGEYLSMVLLVILLLK